MTPHPLHSTFFPFGKSDFQKNWALFEFRFSDFIRFCKWIVNTGFPEGRVKPSLNVSPKIEAPTFCGLQEQQKRSLFIQNTHYWNPKNKS
jgi:hypothetical protein